MKYLIYLTCIISLLLFCSSGCKRTIHRVTIEITYQNKTVVSYSIELTQSMFDNLILNDNNCLNTNGCNCNSGNIACGVQSYKIISDTIEQK